MISLRTSWNSFRYPYIFKWSFRISSNMFETSWSIDDVLNDTIRYHVLLMIFLRYSSNSFEYHRLYRISFKISLNDIWLTANDFLENILNFLQFLRTASRISLNGLNSFKILWISLRISLWRSSNIIEYEEIP